MWFVISRTASGLGERIGGNRYRLFDQYIKPLPIPDATEADRAAIGALALEITDLARARYKCHRETRHRLHTDLGTPAKALNQRLTAWWDLDFTALRAELQKVFRRDIPVAERSQWEAWFTEQRTAHARLTADIVQRETALNARVYALFALTPEEIALIEQSTKYRYGEV
jgi:hypothetical protein